MRYKFEYSIDQPVSLHEKGRRDYSEDYIYPKEDQTVSSTNRLYLVCDGVGGSVRGDEASRFVCTHFPEMVQGKLQTLTQDEYRENAQERFLNAQLSLLETDIDKHIAANPAFKGMATTMTFLHLSPFGAVVAWAGDSRIYQVRNGVAKFISEDHSLVNELVKRGEITREEAANHPRKNVILRAISGTINSTKLDVKVLDDIQQGDYFLLATDGILDGISEQALLALLASGKTLEDMREEIRFLCDAHSRDNYSMYLIRIQSVQKTPLPEQEIVPVNPTVTTIAATARDPIVPSDETSPEKQPVRKAKLLYFLMGLLLLAVMLGATYFLLNKGKGPLERTEKQKTGVTGKKEEWKRMNNEDVTVVSRLEAANKLLKDTVDTLSIDEREEVKGIQINLKKLKDELEKEISSLDAELGKFPDSNELKIQLEVKCKKLGDGNKACEKNGIKLSIGSDNSTSGDQLKAPGTTPGGNTEERTSPAKNKTLWESESHAVERRPDGTFSIFSKKGNKDVFKNKPFAEYVFAIQIKNSNDPILIRKDAGDGKYKWGCIDGKNPAETKLAFNYQFIDQKKCSGKDMVMVVDLSRDTFYIPWPPPKDFASKKNKYKKCE